MAGVYCVLLLLIVASSIDAVPVPSLYPDGSSYVYEGGSVLFEGDMLLPEDAVKRAVAGQNIDEPPSNKHAFGLSGYSSHRWPGGVIPYELTDSVRNTVLNAVGIKGPSERAILNAISEWERVTCLKFVPRTNQKDYVQFVDAGFGKCFSYIGRIGGPQKISIGFGCFTEGVALHEIGHALGFYHEQSRPDRDDYVEIVWDHIKKVNHHNFKKYGRSMINSQGSPYDYKSIMHYGKRAFANWPWQTTIRTLKPGGSSIGNRDHLSAQDIWQMNKAYGCPVSR